MKPQGRLELLSLSLSPSPSLSLYIYHIIHMYYCYLYVHLTLLSNYSLAVGESFEVLPQTPNKPAEMDWSWHVGARGY